jgi:hypothetical protein
MIDYIEIGSSPWGEECAQLGSEGYSERGRAECRAYVGQLYRLLEANGFRRDELPEGFSLGVKGNSHDFGTYYEVVCRFNADDERSVDIAYWLEGNSQELWDDSAKMELKL